MSNRQEIGLSKPIPGNAAAVNLSTAAPSGATDGLALSAFGASPKVRRFRLKLKGTAAGAFTYKPAVWIYDGTDWGLWMGGAVEYDPTHDGLLNAGTALSATTAGAWFFILKNVGIAQRIVVQITAGTGTPTVTGELAEIIEAGD